MFYKLLYPRPTYLVTCAFNGKSNINTIDWMTPVSVKPPALAIAVGNQTQTLDLISRSKEFVLAVPPDSMKEVVLGCAKTSGKFIDKFEEFGIQTAKAQNVEAPLVAGAISQLECKVLQMMNSGDHTIILGEVVETHFPEEDRNSASPLFNKGNKTYFGFQKEWIELAKKEEKAEERKEEKKDDRKEEKKDEKKEEKKPDEKKEKDEKKADEKKDEKKSEEKK